MADDGKNGPMVEISIVGRLSDIKSPAKTPNPDLEQRRQDQESGRRAAQEFAYEALLKNVSLMRLSPDENIQLKASHYIMDRAWGKSKPLTEEEKRSEDAASILDVLARMSASNTQIEQEAAKPKLLERAEDDGQTYDAESFLVEVEQEKGKDG